MLVGCLIKFGEISMPKSKRKNSVRTSKLVAKIAAKVLIKKKTSKVKKTLAGSVLSNRKKTSRK